jgi:hypothetical protein
MLWEARCLYFPIGECDGFGYVLSCLQYQIVLHHLKSKSLDPYSVKLMSNRRSCESPLQIHHKIKEIHSLSHSHAMLPLPVKLGEPCHLGQEDV